MSEKLLQALKEKEDLKDFQLLYGKRALIASEEMREENRERVVKCISSAKEKKQAECGLSALLFSSNYEEEERVKIVEQITSTEETYQLLSAMRILTSSATNSLENPSEYIKSISTATSRKGILYGLALTERAAFLETNIALPLIKKVTQGEYQTLENQIVKVKGK